MPEVQNFKKTKPSKPKDNSVSQSTCKTNSKLEKKQKRLEKRIMAALESALPEPHLPKALKLPELNDYEGIGAMHRKLAENRIAELTGPTRAHLAERGKDMTGLVVVELAKIASDVLKLLPEEYQPLAVLRRQQGATLMKTSDSQDFQQQLALSRALNSAATTLHGERELGRFSNATLNQLISKEKGHMAQEAQYQIRDILKTDPMTGLWCMGGTGTGKSHALAAQARTLLKMKEAGHEDVANLQICYYRTDETYLQMLKAEWEDDYNGPIALYHLKS